MERGRGLTLMRSFMDEVLFNDAGNAVTLIIDRDMVLRDISPTHEFDHDPILQSILDARADQ